MVNPKEKLCYLGQPLLCPSVSLPTLDNNLAHQLNSRLKVRKGRMHVLLVSKVQTSGQNQHKQWEFESCCELAQASPAYSTFNEASRKLNFSQIKVPLISLRVLKAEITSHMTRYSCA